MKTLKRKKQPVTGYRYQQDSLYFAQISESIKKAGVEELSELGAEDIKPTFSGIYFRADKTILYRINYMSRLISRCLAPLISFSCHDTDVLYSKAKQIKWENFFADDSTFAVSGNVSDSTITHSKYASLRLKDAVVDYFREKTGTRPNVSVMNPDILLNLHIRDNRADISLDTSGGPLHKRGYREETVLAPMQETVAAAIIRLTKWDGSVPLYDPMCGSGTLLCEALMRYCNIPAGIFRNRFGFESLPDFVPSVWKQVKKESDETIIPLPKELISGSDLSKEAVKATKTNLMGFHHGNHINIIRADFRNLPTMEKRVIITNPPYGIRMGKKEDLELFYRELGDFLKQKCKGSTAYIYFGERKYIKNIGLKTSWKKPIKAGGLDGRLAKFDMY